MSQDRVWSVVCVVSDNGPRIGLHDTSVSPLVDGPQGSILAQDLTQEEAVRVAAEQSALLGIPEFDNDQDEFLDFRPVRWNDDSECWNALTNGQSPEDFMAISQDLGLAAPDMAVTAYLQGIGDIFPGANYSPAELADIKVRLVRYLTGRGC